MFARWQAFGIAVVFVIAGLGLVLLKNQSKEVPPRAGSSQVDASLKAPVAGGTNQPGVNAGATNKLVPETSEDRTVTLVTEGNQLLSQGKYAEAAQKFEQALALSPGEEDLHYNLAIALAKLGKTEEAKQQYEEALRIYPDYGDAHNNLGNLLMNADKLEEASEHFREAIRITPENASFQNNLGTALARQRKVTEAIGVFTTAIKLNPSFVQARVNLANAYLASGRVEEAIAQLNEALRLHPDFPPAVQTMRRAQQKQASSGTPK
jgi:tetratricopeptide (TPR) repeat protein